MTTANPTLSRKPETPGGVSCSDLLVESSEPKCRCRRCLTERGAIRTGSLAGNDLTTILMGTEFVGMILCEICGNKRCPHATDHRHACTDSNEPGQPGSIFG